MYYRSITIAGTYRKTKAHLLPAYKYLRYKLARKENYKNKNLYFSCLSALLTEHHVLVNIRKFYY